MRRNGYGGYKRDLRYQEWCEESEEGKSLFHSTISSRHPRKWSDRKYKSFCCCCFAWGLLVFLVLGGVFFPMLHIELWSSAIEFSSSQKLYVSSKKRLDIQWKSTDPAAIKHSSPSAVASSAVPILLTAGKGKVVLGDHDALFSHP